MSLLGRVMLIPYFTAYLIHYSYNLKTKCDKKSGHQNRFLVHKKVYIEKKTLFKCKVSSGKSGNIVLFLNIVHNSMHPLPSAACIGLNILQ